MAGSVAEERIRGKVEAKLRLLFPEARLIHELVLKQGGVRIDLAAVTTARLICIEIKSERDVMTRLPDQCAAMRLVCDTWSVRVADEWLDPLREIAGWLHACPESAPDGAVSNWAGLTAPPRDAMLGLCPATARLELHWARQFQCIHQIEPPPH